MLSKWQILKCKFIPSDTDSKTEDILPFYHFIIKNHYYPTNIQF
jgi:hypothetical protein